MKKKSTYIGIKFRSIFVAATLSMLVEYALGLTDLILVGQLIGNAALPALTLIEPLNLIVSFVGCMLAAGAGMQISVALGIGKQAKAEKQFSQAIILAVGVGAIITAVYCAFSRPIVDALAAGRPEAAYMAQYLRFSRFLPIPLLLNSVAYPILLYRGGEKYCNFCALVCVAGNVGLSLALIPVMGMAGVSLGTVIGSWMGLVPAIFFLSTKKGRMKFRFHLSLSDIRSMGVYSVCDSIIYLYRAVFQLCMNAFLLHRFDSAAIVVFTGVINLIGLFAALSEGIGEFLLSAINMYRGEKNVIGERNTFLTSLKASIAEGLIVMIAMLVFAGAMPSLLGVRDAAVRSDFILAARIYVLCAPFFYVLNLYAGYYLYIGKMRHSLAISLCLNLLFPLVFGLLFGLALGMTGIWIGMAVSLPALLALAYLIIRRQKGADRLCLFLDHERAARQRCWNVDMTPRGIASLMDSVQRALLEKGVSRSRINRVLLAIEETQMDDLHENKHAARERIECTLYLEEKITLVLRNTGVVHNATAPDAQADNDEEKLFRRHILSSMQSKSYILVNGSNRLIFEF